MSRYGDVMLAMADEIKERTAKYVIACDPVLLSDFATRLCGLEGMNYRQLCERLADLEMPGDFRHFELWNMSTDRDWGGQVNQFMQPLELNDLLRFISIVSNREDATAYGPGLWTATQALPIRASGTLSLGLHYQPLH